MENEHLYTVIVEVYETQEVFIHQVRTKTTDLDRLLYTWVEQAVARSFIKGTDDPQVPFRDITERNKCLEPLESVFNVWRIIFLVGKDFYAKNVIRARNEGIFDVRESICLTVDFIKTSTSDSALISSSEYELTAEDSPRLRQAEKNYALYQERYNRLKSVSALSKTVNKERKLVERWMLYWDAKRKFREQFFNRDANTKDKNLYTVRFDYEHYHNSGVFIRQLNLIGSDPNYVLYKWAIWLMHDTWRLYEDSDERAQIINDQDRLLLMNKISSGTYTPVLVTGLTNVWSTYFSLSGGMVKLTIIRTARDELVQG